MRAASIISYSVTIKPVIIILRRLQRVEPQGHPEDQGRNSEEGAQLQSLDSVSTRALPLEDFPLQPDLGLEMRKLPREFMTIRF
jgi:hypothetical protein